MQSQMRYCKQSLFFKKWFPIESQKQNPILCCIQATDQKKKVIHEVWKVNYRQGKYKLKVQKWY